MIDYPEGLPPPVRDNFSSKYGRPFNRLKMDDGGRRPLPMWSAQPREFRLTWFLTWAQLAKWEGWYEYDLKCGALPGNVPIQDGVMTEIMMLEDPNRAYDSNRGHWVVSVTCQTILPAPNIPVEGASAPTWPSSLPDIEKEGYEYVTEGAIHSSIKDGYQDGRQRWKRRRTDVKVRFILDADQKVIFESFLHDTLAGGLAYFYIPVAGGPGVAMAKAQFTEPPTITPLGAKFQVTGLLDTFDLPKLTEFQYRYGDGVTVREGISFKDEVDLGRVAFASDGIRFSEQISVRTTKPAADGVAFEDQVSYIVLYSRQLSDGVAFSEEVSSSSDYRRAVPAEGITFSEYGYASTQTYFAEDYFGEDYFGHISFFQ